jgi:23S rRNA (uracil1939-C5)-methyltransferase
MHIVAASDLYELRLEGIAPGGDALGRFEGKPVFVEGGAPDETVYCRITEDHKSWARAELLEIIEPSPVRTGVFCAFYGVCGGCNLQHIDYDAQIRAKTAILTENITRIGGFCSPKPEVFPSPPQEYRNRMQFHCIRQPAHGEKKISFGLKGRASGNIAAVSDCPVADSGIRELLQGNGKAIRLPPEKDRFNVYSRDGLFLNEGGIHRGKTSLLGREIVLDAGVFFQSNGIMLEKLISQLLEIAAASDRSLPLVDLYSGVGTFAAFLGGMFPKVSLVEENKQALAIARENLNGIDADFFACRDTDWVRETGLQPCGCRSAAIWSCSGTGVLAGGKRAVCSGLCVLRSRGAGA